MEYACSICTADVSIIHLRIYKMQKITDNIFLLVLFAMTGTFILATSFIFFFLRYQRKAQQQREAMQRAELEHSEKLLHAALQSQEDERRRIGRDLHDDVGAALSNLRMVMGQGYKMAENEGKDTTAYKPLIDNIITTVRNISHSLSPPGLELFGLEHTLYELCDTFNTSGVIRLSFINEAGSRVDGLEKNTALATYRVLQELISNTIKHAEAKKIVIRFCVENNRLVLVYSDDGKGFDASVVKKTGMGLQNIEARLSMVQAAFTVNTSPGNGIMVRIILSK
jgi:signal transduction histidine kinase